jgi:hypothetical protein
MLTICTASGKQCLTWDQAQRVADNMCRADKDAHPYHCRACQYAHVASIRPELRTRPRPLDQPRHERIYGYEDAQP